MAAASRRSDDFEVDVYVNVNVNEHDASFGAWMETRGAPGRQLRVNAGTIRGSQNPVTIATRSMLTPEGPIPIKTAEGLDELARRTRRLSQRHRTVLLLVDGRRSTEQVIALAAAAGVQHALFDELMTLGLIEFQSVESGADMSPASSTEVSVLPHITGAEVRAAVPGADAPTAEAVSGLATTAPPIRGDQRAARVSDGKPWGSLDADQPLKGGEPVVAAASATAAHHLAPTAARETAAASAEDDDPFVAPSVGPEPSQGSSGESMLPPVQSLPPDSAWSELSERVRRGPSGVDRPLEEARDILLRAVRAEAPIAGRLLLLKVKRAGSRVELDALLDEVEARISKPRRMIAAAQTMRHVRHLLGMPADTATMYGTGP